MTSLFFFPWPSNIVLGILIKCLLTFYNCIWESACLNAAWCLNSLQIVLGWDQWKDCTIIPHLLGFPLHCTNHFGPCNSWLLGTQAVWSNRHMGQEDALRRRRRRRKGVYSLYPLVNGAPVRMAGRSDFALSPPLLQTSNLFGYSFMRSCGPGIRKGWWGEERARKISDEQCLLLTYCGIQPSTVYLAKKSPLVCIVVNAEL